MAVWDSATTSPVMTWLPLLQKNWSSWQRSLTPLSTWCWKLLNQVNFKFAWLFCRSIYLYHFALTIFAFAILVVLPKVRVIIQIRVVNCLLSTAVTSGGPSVVPNPSQLLLLLLTIIPMAYLTTTLNIWKEDDIDSILSNKRPTEFRKNFQPLNVF